MLKRGERVKQKKYLKNLWLRIYNTNEITQSMHSIRTVNTKLKKYDKNYLYYHSKIVGK